MSAGKPRIRLFQTYEGPYIFSLDEFLARSTSYLFDNDILINVGDDDNPVINFSDQFVEFLKDRNRNDILGMMVRGVPIGFILAKAKFTAEEAVEIKLKFNL